MDKTVRFVDNKAREIKENGKLTTKKDDANSNKKYAMIKPDSNISNEIQVSDTDSNIMMGEYDDSISWRSLPWILESLDKDDTCNTDDDK